jgi:hypothetical protein
MAKKHLVLNIAEMQSDFFLSSALIGISSVLPAHRLCWLLNKKFALNFIRQPGLDIPVQKAKEQQQFFGMYEYCVPLSETRHLFYKLKNNEDVLLSEIKQLDYLWMIQGDEAQSEADAMIAQLRSLPEIQLAQPLSPEKLKHLSYLLV